MINIEDEELKDTFKKLNSLAHHRYKDSDEFSKEECHFIVFTEFLEKNGIFRNINVSKTRRKFRQGYLSIAGYSRHSISIQEDEMDIESNSYKDISEEYNYTLFNGAFKEDKVSTIPISDVRRLIKETKNFLISSLTNNLIQDNSEVREFQENFKIQYLQEKIDRIDICILTNQNLSNIEKDDNKILIEDEGLNIECNVYYWDLRKYNDLKRSKLKRIPIEINFDKDYPKYKIKSIYFQVCKFNNYIAVFPCSLIADLYQRHHTQLLESNIRVFLSMNRKANKSMKQTLCESPENFFSYNNGISATASSVDTDSDGIILRVSDFQIINGGQTAATLYHVRRTNKNNLSKAFVQVKIISIKNQNGNSMIVKDISRAANTQSLIKSSDFYSNHPYLVHIDKYSKSFAYESHDKYLIYYFFERMSGQYKVTKNNFIGRKLTYWDATHPKNLIFKKIDLARWANCMNGQPHIAALSAEKQFVIFMKNLDRHKVTDISENDYKTLIGFGMLFNRARKLCGFAKSKLYPSIIGDSSVGMATTIYSMAYFHFISKGYFDYHKIYSGKLGVTKSLVNSNRRVESDMDSVIIEIIQKCWGKIAEYGETSAQEQTKKESCWDYVRKKVSLNHRTIESLNKWKLSDKQQKERKAKKKADDEIYFESLDRLIGNNGEVLKFLHELTKRNRDFKKHRTTIVNFIQKINNKKSFLLLSKVEEIIKIVNMTSEFDDVNSFSIDIVPVNVTSFNQLFNLVYRNHEKFKEDMEKKIFEAIDLEKFNVVKDLEEILNQSQ